MQTTTIKHTKAGIAEAALKLLAEAERISDCPLTQYAHLVAVRRAAEDALKHVDQSNMTVQDYAVIEAQEEYPHAESQQFEHEGLTFQFKAERHYDFTGYGAWNTKQAQITGLQDKLKVRKTELQSLESDYVARHKPIPDSIKLSVSFLPQ